MVELPQAHLGTDIFTHRHQCYSDDRERLESGVLFLRIEVIVAVVEHILNFQDVAGSCKRAHFQKDLSLLRDRV